MNKDDHPKKFTEEQLKDLEEIFEKMRKYPFTFTIPELNQNRCPHCGQTIPLYNYYHDLSTD